MSWSCTVKGEAVQLIFTEVSEKRVPVARHQI